MVIYDQLGSLMNLFAGDYQPLTLKLAWDKKYMQCGQLPAQQKESLVISLFKKGSRYLPLNYRSIRLTSVCCKTLEREIAAYLYEYIDSNGLFHDDQFGFRRRCRYC